MRPSFPWAAPPATLVLALLAGAYGSFFATGLLHQVPGTANVAGPPSLANYARLVADSAQLDIFAHTFGFALLLSAVTAVIGYPLALFTARTESRRLRLLFLAILVATFLSGSVTRAYGWLVLLGNRGLLNTLLLQAGVIDAPLRIVYRDLGVGIALVHFMLPFFVLTVVGGIGNVPRAMEEASRDLGAGPARTFLRVTLPLSLPAVAEAAALSLALALSAFLFPLLLGGGRVRMVANYIYDQIFVAFDMPFAAAVSAAFLLCCCGALMLMGALQRWLLRQLSGRGAAA
jgi:putative spermidine/putrescine transport system permease protein